MKSFLKNKNIILIIKKYTQTKRQINVSILQNSLFFLILYLFYNANLLKMCKNIKLRFSVTDFMNDIFFIHTQFNILYELMRILYNCVVIALTLRRLFHLYFFSIVMYWKILHSRTL